MPYVRCPATQTATAELRSLKEQVSELRTLVDGVSSSEAVARESQHRQAVTEKQLLQQGYEVQALRATLAAKVRRVAVRRLLRPLGCRWHRAVLLQVAHARRVRHTLHSGTPQDRELEAAATALQDRELEARMAQKRVVSLQKVYEAVLSTYSEAEGGGGVHGATVTLPAHDGASSSDASPLHANAATAAATADLPDSVRAEVAALLMRADAVKGTAGNSGGVAGQTRQRRSGRKGRHAKTAPAAATPPGRGMSSQSWSQPDAAFGAHSTTGSRERGSRTPGVRARSCLTWYGGHRTGSCARRWLPALRCVAGCDVR